MPIPLARARAIWVGIALLAGSLVAAPPVWWSERGVLVSGAMPHDYAAANLGQVKQIAKQAVAEMNAKLPGGAGATLNELVESWAQPPAPGVPRNDYAAVSQGQLKALAKKFYDRLAEAGYRGPPLSADQTYPWTTTPVDDDNYAPANIGQVKFLFSFDLTLISDPNDTDADGLPDAWELDYFGDLASTGASDPDGDGVANQIEFKQGRDPTKLAVTDAANPTVQLRLFDFGP